MPQPLLQAAAHFTHVQLLLGPELEEGEKESLVKMFFTGALDHLRETPMPMTVDALKKKPPVASIFHRREEKLLEARRENLRLEAARPAEQLREAKDAEKDSGTSRLSLWSNSPWQLAHEELRNEARRAVQQAHDIVAAHSRQRQEVLDAYQAQQFHVVTSQAGCVHLGSSWCIKAPQHLAR